MDMVRQKIRTFTNSSQKSGQSSSSKRDTVKKMDPGRRSGSAVLVYDLQKGETMKMPRSEAEAKWKEHCKEVQILPISWNKSQIPVWLKGPYEQSPVEWFASVRIPPSVRFLSVFGKYDTLYVTVF